MTDDENAAFKIFLEAFRAGYSGSDYLDNFTVLAMRKAFSAGTLHTLKHLPDIDCVPEI